MGILSYLGPGLTAASQAVSGLQRGQEAARRQALLEAQQQRQQSREDEQDRLRAALTVAQTGHLNAQTAKEERPEKQPQGTIHQADDGTIYSVLNGIATPVSIAPKETATEASPPPSSGAALPVTPTPPQGPVTPPTGKAATKPLLKGKVTPLPVRPGSLEWRQMKIDEAKIGAQYGYHPPPQEQGQVVTGERTLPDGTKVPTYGIINKKDKSITPLDDSAMRPKATAVGGAGGSGGGGMGQGVQARLLGAVSEARAASKRMDAYENKMIENPDEATPGFATQLGGKLATRMAGQHSIVGIAGETAGEALTNPEYLQYMRDAGLMARATQLMSSRGGSEAMVAAEQLLNRAVPNKDGLAGSIAAARKSRNAIFGPVGGLMQALTPEQIQKVEAGLAALEKGESGGTALQDAAKILDGARAQQPQRRSTDKPQEPPQRRSTDVKPVSALRQKYDAAVAHLRAMDRESEIASLPVPPDEEE